MSRMLVSLKTIEPERDFIDIDGESFFVRTHEELNIISIAHLRKLSGEVLAIQEESPVTEEGVAKIALFSDQVLDIIVIGLPEETKKRLSNDQKLQVIHAFIKGASPTTEESATQAPEGTN